VTGPTLGFGFAALRAEGAAPYLTVVEMERLAAQELLATRPEPGLTRLGDGLLWCYPAVLALLPHVLYAGREQVPGTWQDPDWVAGGGRYLEAALDPALGVFELDLASRYQVAGFRRAAAWRGSGAWAARSFAGCFTALILHRGPPAPSTPRSVVAWLEYALITLGLAVRKHLDEEARGEVSSRRREDRP